MDTETRQRFNRGIISDILLWVALSGLLALLVWVYAIQLPKKAGQTFTLQFKDANEVTKGSSVRMMGTEIGFVSDVHIRQDHVDITITTDPDALPVPSGSTFTVLFTGLAGSKSIEIELPDRPGRRIFGQPVYLVEEPIRLQDVLNYNIDMTQALQRGAENITDFFGKKKPVEELQFNIRQAREWTVDSLQFMAYTNEQITQFDRFLSLNAMQAVDTLGGFDAGARRAIVATDPARVRPKVQSAVDSIRKFNRLFVDETSGGLNTVYLYTRLNQLNAGNARISTWMQNATLRVETFPLGDYLLKADKGSGQFLSAVSKADTWLDTHNLGAMLLNAQRKILGFNRRVILWSGATDAAFRDYEATGHGHLVDKLKGTGSAVSGTETSPPGGSGAETTAGASTDGTTTAAPESIVIVDRNGNPISTVKPHWWQHHPAAARIEPQADASAVPHKPWWKRLFSAIGGFFASIWDGLKTLF